MRDSIINPLKISYQELLQKFSVNKEDVKSFAIRDGGAVKGGFTFETYGCVFYGIQQNDIVSVFGIDELSESMPAVVEDFIKSNNLYFINWHTLSKV